MSKLIRCRTTDSLTWSVPAGPDCPAFGRANVCRHCYARKGRYASGRVRRALRQRRLWWDQTDPDVIVDTLVSELRRTRRYVRVFKAGDFRNRWDAALWLSIMGQSPHVRFWVSTKSWIDPAIVGVLRLMHRLPNVCVRRSALGVDCPVVEDPQLPCVSLVARGGRGCPKQRGAGSCAKAKCRRCWNKRVPTVTYRLH